MVNLQVAGLVFRHANSAPAFRLDKQKLLKIFREHFAPCKCACPNLGRVGEAVGAETSIVTPRDSEGLKRDALLPNVTAARGGWL